MNQPLELARGKGGGRLCPEPPETDDEPLGAFEREDQHIEPENIILYT